MNMIRIYLKQAWETARQNRLFSSIYVVGTGLSIALTMTLFIIFYVKTAPIYPEYNRDRTLVVRYVKSYPPDKPENWSAGLVSPTLAELADSLPHVDDVAVTMSSGIRGQYVALPGQKQTFNIFLLYVNADFWRVFPFRFLSGKPLTEADVEARTPTAVISESLARRLFASTDVAGKTFHYRGRPYTVSGVVQDVSSATPDVVADVWMPLSLDAASSFDDPDFGLMGNLTCFLLVDDADNKEAVKESLREAVRRHDAGRERVNDLMGQPDDAALSTFRTNPANAPDTDGLFRSLLYIVLALLFIPAVNLSGMIASRMDRRTGELGIRKAYGATRATLLGQVLWENLLLTLAGAVAGLVFCYVIVLTSGSWILTLFDTAVKTSLPTPFLTMEMLFNPWVFLCTFALCLVLNVVSALLPAWWGLRHTIVEELYTKR